MVDFIRRRLQVFVSSTFDDLLDERQAAVEAILTSGHIPAGMELFASGDESQMEVIKQWIDESDVYCLILGGRYGSVEPSSQKSYIQLEYEYAIERGKPFFACIINETALEKKVKGCGSKVIETSDPHRLKEFRNSVLSKTVRFWDDSKDIKIAIGEALSQFARREDLVGWVRPHAEANMPAMVDEITRLSKENALLRAEKSNLRPEVLIHGLSFRELLSVLEVNGLLGYLESWQDELSVGDVYPGSSALPKAEKLVLHGLLTPSIGHGKFRITDGGRAFFNKLALYRIEESGQVNKNP